MKAQTLEEVIQYFDAQKPLSGQFLAQWFIERPGRARRKLEVFLLANRRKAPKTLLIGHRGSGKSTELNQLTKELTENYKVISIDLLDHISLSDIRYEDLMLTLAIQVTRACIDEKLITPTVGDKLNDTWQPIRRWWQEVVAGSLPREQSLDVETYGELSLFLTKLSVGVQSSSFSREQMVEKINRQMSDLLAHLRRVIEAAESTLNPRRLLIVVEGTDKIDLASARRIFFDHTQTITSLNAAMIYTFPLALYRSSDFNTVSRYLDNHEFLHNIGPYHHDGSTDEESMHALRKLVRIRLDADLLTDEALNELARASGGVLANLVRLVNNAALFALTRQDSAFAGRIEKADALDAVRELRDDFSASLSLADWRTLAKVRSERILTNEAKMQELFFSGALVEYTNDFPWCDVHPVLWSALSHYMTDE